MRFPASDTAVGISAPHPYTIKIRSTASNAGRRLPRFDMASGLDTTTTGTKTGCSVGADRLNAKARRQIGSSEREILCWYAVADTRRGPCRLSSTVWSFLPSDQRLQHLVLQLRFRLFS